MNLPNNKTLVLFDGECNLCNGFINFVIDRDPEARFVFAPLQSSAGQEVRQRYLPAPGAIDSIVLYEPGRGIQVKSAAAILILRQLGGAWPLLQAGLLLPAGIRDRIYDWVARNRYRWFGKGACRIPTPELRARFWN